jgi:tetratricopeptide (TPR) repeat protein
MIPKTNFFDQIEDYCLGQLEEDFKLEFEAELLKNRKLKNELDLWKEIQSAVEEKEVLTLRDKLENVTKQNKPILWCNESFEMLNEFSEFQEITEILSSEELVSFYDSLPKVHAYHHISTSNENIHRFYKTQNNSDANNTEVDLDDFDFDEFEGLEEALLEKDILQFRQTLKQVAKSIEPQFSVEEIDNYLTGELSDRDFYEFESNLLQNRTLQNEVKLHQEIEMSIQENDVMDLRSKISNILGAETSWNVSETSIEDFIDGVLEGELLEEFELELHDNSDLMAEVELRKQVNDAILEKDIFDLRNKLSAAKESAGDKKVKMLIPETREGQIKFWRSSVAILIVLIGLAGVLTNGLVSVSRTYDNYFESPSWSAERSVSSDVTLLQQANIAYINADYNKVVQILSQLPASNYENPVSDFYLAASLQKLNRYEDAITAYSSVIKQGDNLFIEEAQWYRSLCYLKLGDQKKARIELLAVIERKGHFEGQAKALIRRLKYSF